ncbi:hypothetical protein PRIPAC_76943 [Pristionchus pacificus]|uniref:Uncharacterized protein n=1 Tax=Pristionchus pacificus TaxID=54126 RepID=A0A2A6BXP0_PRIPA|nr:hypothetical protein PRIPAC_76943 [Pristionchus pacificus]|eukprot:PDM70626.1 hypothetical protein PRIPAC_46872 [Pristionchus pacificus]
MLKLLVFTTLTAAIASSLTITGTITCKDAPIVGAKLFLRTVQGRARSQIVVDVATDEEGRFAVEVPEKDLDIFNKPKTIRHLDYENKCAKSALGRACDKKQ